MFDNATAPGAEPAWNSGHEPSCPTPHALTLYCSHVLARFVHSRDLQLTREEADRIARHMSECPRCIARFNAIIDVSREPGPGPLLPRWPGPAIALGALATAALALAMMVLVQSTNDLRPPSLADKFDRGEVLNIQRPPQPPSQPTGRHNRLTATQSENPAPVPTHLLKVTRARPQTRRSANPPASVELTSSITGNGVTDTSSANHRP